MTIQKLFWAYLHKTFGGVQRHFQLISIISWRSVLMVEGTGVSEKTTDLTQVTDKRYL
jgi:hypothetical protein